MENEWQRGEAGLYLERGEALEQAGRLDEAMGEYKRAVRADPGLAEAHIALGFHYRRKNLLSKAAEEFRTSASLAPSYDSYFNLGHVLVDLGQPEEAIGAFRKCLALAPEDPAVRYEIAYAYYTGGQYETALGELRPLLDSYPGDWELHYLAGSAQLALGDYKTAEASFQHAQELLPPGEEGEGLADALQAALRHQEFPAREPWDIKARLYAEFGIVCLGAMGDDGLHIPVLPRDRLSYEDLGRMLQRFHALRLRWRWQFDVVVPVDEQSLPLAIAVAHSLRAPLAEVEDTPRAGLSLLVWSAVTVPELLTVTAERVAGRYVSFVASLAESDLDRVLPDIIGVVGSSQMALPWADAHDRHAVTAAARDIVSALKSLPPDATLVEQVRYYTQAHRRLRFFPSV